MKIKEPKINYLENSTFEECLLQDEFSNVLIDKDCLIEIKIEDKTIDGCVFKNINFSNIELNNIDLVDVRFENCDLSNKCFNKQFISRVVFKDCKMIGTTFIEANLKDVLVETSMGRYLNLAEAKINNLMIKQSDLSEASFLNVMMKNFEIEKTKLNKTEFIKTKLVGVDFRGNEITGVIFDQYSLEGIILDSFQCRNIAVLFGVKVED